MTAARPAMDRASSAAQGAMAAACWHRGEREWAVNCARQAMEMEPGNGEIRRELAEMSGNEP